MIWTPATLPKLQPVVARVDLPQTFFLTVEEGGVTVRIQVWLDAREHAFRTLTGIGAIKAEQLLGALLSVSDGSLSSVEGRFTKVLRVAALEGLASVVEDPDGGMWAKSRIAPPLEIIDVEVQATTWRRAFKAVNEWAGYGPRRVRLPVERRTDPLTLADASMYGIGVAFGAEPVPTLEPTIFMPLYGSSAKWQVVERLYAELLEADLIA